MTAIQLGSLRNSLITDQHDMLFSGTEAIKCVATRFGAVWLAKSAFTFRRLVSESAGDKPMSMKLAALSRIEEELLLIGECTTNIRLSLDVKDVGDQGLHPKEELPVIREDEHSEDAKEGEAASSGGGGTLSPLENSSAIAPLVEELRKIASRSSPLPWVPASAPDVGARGNRYQVTKRTHPAVRFSRASWGGV